LTVSASTIPIAVPDLLEEVDATGSPASIFLFFLFPDPEASLDIRGSCLTGSSSTLPTTALGRLKDVEEAALLPDPPVCNSLFLLLPDPEPVGAPLDIGGSGFTGSSTIPIWTAEFIALDRPEEMEAADSPASIFRFFVLLPDPESPRRILEDRDELSDNLSRTRLFGLEGPATTTGVLARLV